MIWDILKKMTLSVARGWKWCDNKEKGKKWTIKNKDNKN